MPKQYFQNVNKWDLFSKLILLGLSVLLIVRWSILPQFLDIYYHLQVAWGFIQSGGYSSWDFWEYAPFGRPHIYPPLLHFLLAFLIKLGFSLVFLAKFFEAVTPIILLLTIWNFIRKNFSQQLGFFVVVALSSSFAFSISLANHIPSTFALIFGFLSFKEFFKNRFLRAVILLVLCFYTHISVSWFFALSYIFYAIMHKDSRLNSLRVAFYSLLLALPILIGEFLNLQFIHLVGNNILEKFHLQIKLLDYLLAGFGLFLAVKMNSKYKLFISLFLASLIFLRYPARFLSAEGYIPVALFSALTLQFIWQKVKGEALKAGKMVIGILIAFILFISPTLFLDKTAVHEEINFKVDWVDSTFSGLLLAKGKSIWFPWAYLSAVDIIKENSSSKDIVYSNLNVAGLILSSLAQRATANALLPETRSFSQVDPFAVSNIIVLPKDLDEKIINGISNKYNLMKIKESDYFSVFRNPAPIYKLKIANAVISFPVIIIIFFLLVFLYFSQELVKILKFAPNQAKG